MKVLYSTPGQICFLIFCLGVAAFGHPETKADYFRLMTVATTGLAILYVPVMAWQDRFMPYRPLLFGALQLLLLGGMATVIYDFHDHFLTWYSAPVAFTSSMMVVIYVYLRFEKHVT